MDSPDAPPAPDYAGAAQATAAGNLQNLNAQTWANRPTQVTPWGTTNWSNSTDTAAYERALADWQAAGSNPDVRPTQNSYTTWTQHMNLTPETQAALDSQQQVQMNQSELAQTLQGQAAQTMAGGFNAPQVGSYMSNVPSVQTGFASFNPIGNGTITDPNAFTAGAGNVDLNAPQFNNSTAQAGANAAYEASTGLLKDQWQQDTKNLDNQLRAYSARSRTPFRCDGGQHCAVMADMVPR